MGDQADAYSAYEIGLDRLLTKMGRDHSCYSEALVLQQRLMENIIGARQYGDNDTRKTERNEIIDRLNKLALSTVAMPFRDLYVTPTTRREQTEHPLLSLVELSSEEPVNELARLLLEDLSQAHSHNDLETMEQLYLDILRCGDPEEKGVAQLYLADVRARSNRLDEGTILAKRAIDNFEIAEDNHNRVVARLFLARLNQASGNINEAKDEYRKASILWQKPRPDVKGTIQSEENTSYRQIGEAIQQGQRDVGKKAKEQFRRRLFLSSMDPIPALQPGDGPDAILRSSEVIDFVKTDVFQIRGHEYFLYPPGNTEIRTLSERRTLMLKAGMIHFAFPVPHDGWLNTISSRGDYALVRRETQASDEGPGISWTDIDWVEGQFRRDPATGEIHFEPPRPYIIGMGSIIALFRQKIGN